MRSYTRIPDEGARTGLNAYFSLQSKSGWLTWINRGRPGTRIMTNGNSGFDAMKRVLALAAVLFLLLRPVCDVWAATHDHDEHGVAADAAASVADGRGAQGHPDDFCCAKVQDGNLIMSGGAVSAITGSDGSWFGPIALSYATLPRTVRPITQRPPDALHRRASYHARSARILR
jgi:hypothetical protein